MFLVPGNWEPTKYQNGRKEEESWSKIKKGLKNIKDIENKKTIFKGITLIGHGSTSAPEPFEKRPKKEFKDKEDYEMVKRLRTFRRNFALFLKTCF